jgi:hypothetical protein
MLGHFFTRREDWQYAVFPGLRGFRAGLRESGLVSSSRDDRQAGMAAAFVAAVMPAAGHHH